MGTRADFYVGRGTSAEWDGNPYSVFEDAQFAERLAQAHYREWVADYLSKRNDASLPADGWPWPWEDSSITDYAYAWDGDEDGGSVYASCFGHPWFKVDLEVDGCGEPQDEDEDGEGDGRAPTTIHPPAVFPKMRTDRAAPAGSRQSGVMVIRF